MTTTPQAASVQEHIWRVGLCASSSRPHDQIPCLARSEREIASMEKHGSFIRWLSPRSDELSAALDAQEPVYQYRKADGSWIDQSKSSHDYNVKHGAATVRVLYTQPQTQKAAAPATDIDEAQLARMTENGAKAWAGHEAAAPATNGYQAALEIRAAQGWKMTGAAIPVLYTDTINGQQVCRDDVWLCTTEALAKPAAAPELVGWQPIETAPDDMTRCVVVRWTDAEGQEHTDLDYKEDGCWIGWHEHAEHVQMIGGHGVSHTPPYAQWLQLPPADGAAMAGQPEKGSQP